MAKQNKEKERREAYIRKEKEKKYKAAVKNVHYIPYITAALIVIAIILFSLTWASVYNSDMSKAEVQISGWNCLVAALTGNYSSPESVYGDMAMPFYYYATEYCERLSIFTLISFIVLLGSIVLQVLTIVLKKHSLNYISIAVNCI